HCTATTNFFIIKGEIATIDGHTLLSDLADMGNCSTETRAYKRINCGPFCRACLTQNQVVVWKRFWTYDPDSEKLRKICPFEYKGVKDATLTRDHVTIDEIQGAFAFRKLGKHGHTSTHVGAPPCLPAATRLTEQNIGIRVKTKLPEEFQWLTKVSTNASYSYPNSSIFPKQTEADAVNSKLEYLKERILQNEKAAFRNVWLALCSVAQRQLDIIHQLLALDATMGARAFLQRTDITAQFAGEALLVSQCRPVSLQQIFWDYTYNGHCFLYLPVIHNSTLYFVLPGTRDLVRSAPKVNCHHHVTGYYRDHINHHLETGLPAWRSTTGSVSVSEIPIEIAWSTDWRPFTFNSPPLFHNVHTGMVSILGRLHGRLIEVDRMQHMLEGLVNYTSSTSLDPTTFKRGYEVIRDGIHSVQHNFSSMANNFLSGFVQMLINIGVTCLAIVIFTVLAFFTLRYGLPKLCCCLLRCLCKRTRPRHRNPAAWYQLWKRRLHLPVWSTARPIPKTGPKPVEFEMAEVSNPLVVPSSATVTLQTTSATVSSPIADAVAPLSQADSDSTDSQLPLDHLTTATVHASPSSTAEQLQSQPATSQPSEWTGEKWDTTNILQAGNSQLLQLWLRINGVQVQALIDTGASISLLCKSIFDQLVNTVPSTVCQTSSTISRINTASGHSLSVLTSLITTVQLPQHILQHTFHVVDLTGTNQVCVIGLDLLKRFGQVHFDFLNSTVTLDTAPAPPQPKKGGFSNGAQQTQPSASTAAPEMEKFLLFCHKTTTLPAHTMQATPVHAPAIHHSPVDVTFIGDYNKLYNHQLSATDSLLTLDHGIGTIWLLNRNSYPVTLYQDTRLGTVDILTGTEHLYQLQDATTDQPITWSQKDILQQVDLSKCDASLSSSDKHKLLSLLTKFQDIFSKHSRDRGRTDQVQHAIHTGMAPPFKLRPYPIAFAQRAVMKQHIMEQLEDGLIEASNSPYASPALIVKKKNDDKGRFVIDYRTLNAQTVKDSYPLLRTEDVFMSLGGTRFFSTLDIASAYWQVELAPEDKPKTAFTSFM
ncbi:MAG: hypothetical protein GY737_32335, partial [Desulfobacteraceae bacterium]|nr:hypothetical protein [Desulfobacteraceae bacterium]